MTDLKLITYPNNILRQPCTEIENLSDPDINDLILKMVKIMNDSNGIGLAAPQVGIHKNLIIVATENGPLPLINPKITKFSRKKETAEEGCLSIPGVYGMVKRPAEINITALTHEGKEISFKAKEMFARVLQHEIDHLNGVLFTDHTSDFTKGKFDPKAESKSAE